MKPLLKIKLKKGTAQLYENKGDKYMTHHFLIISLSFTLIYVLKIA